MTQKKMKNNNKIERVSSVLYRADKNFKDQITITAFHIHFIVESDLEASLSYLRKL